MLSLLRLIAAAFFALCSLPASAQEGVFWSKKDLLENFFIRSEKVISEDVILTPEQMEEVKKLIGYKPPRSHYTFFKGITGNNTDGYILIDEQLGQHKPITYAVHISPDGKVIQTEVMIYREPQGGEVKDKRFMRQFAGKNIDNSIRVNTDIISISGATISSKSLAVGVKRALGVWNVVYKNP